MNGSCLFLLLSVVSYVLVKTVLSNSLASTISYYLLLPLTLICITITSDLSLSSHIDSIVSKAHQRANIIRRCFVSRNVDLLVRAFITYVRPVLEYNSVTWSPHLKYHIERIEKVQRRFTKKEIVWF